jgi:hypothetical protein
MFSEISSAVSIQLRRGASAGTLNQWRWNNSGRLLLS